VIVYVIMFILAILCGILAIHVRLLAIESHKTRERLHKLEGCTKTLSMWMNTESRRNP
jgi:hypothetical protein